MPPKQRTATISADQQRSLINGVNNLVSAAQALGTLLKDLFPETINSNEQVVDSTMEGNATVTELDEDLALQPAAKDTLKAVNAELPTANEHEAQAAIDSFDSSNAMKIDEKIEEPDVSSSIYRLINKTKLTLLIAPPTTHVPDNRRHPSNPDR